MNVKKSKSVSSYQQYLPAILQEDVFIGQFLLAFEKILSGLDQTPSQEKIINVQGLGLEEIIDNIHLYFDPQRTPEEFLPWLAGWVALSLRDDWKEDVKRAFIQQIVELYRWRGTNYGLTKILKLYLKNSELGEDVEVFDQFDDFPNYFQVQLTLTDRDPDKYWRQAKIAKAIIDREKPAQTFYTLKILVPTMQLTQASHVAFPLKLFALPQNQKFTIEVKITPNINNIPINQLAKQLVIQLQGNSEILTLDSPQTIISNQAFSIKHTLNYQQLQENLEGFNVILSNRTDRDFSGILAIKIYFNINDKEFNNTLLEQPVNLSPVLKICSQNNAGEIIEGNTIFYQPSQTQLSAMKITEYMWSIPYNFRVFAPPKIQKLQPDIIAIVEKLELEAIIEITKPNPITKDLLNKITLRLKDDFSDYHLFTPETVTTTNQIRIKRTLYYQEFMQKLNELKVTIQNLNNMEIGGQVFVQVTLNINQLSSTYEILRQKFIVAPTPPGNILQICSKNEKDEKGAIIEGETIPTILGTKSQSLS